MYSTFSDPLQVCIPVHRQYNIKKFNFFYSTFTFLCHPLKCWIGPFVAVDAWLRGAFSRGVFVVFLVTPGCVRLSFDNLFWL